jgi:hypothetical protein
MNVYGAYSLVAGVSALASFLLGWGSIKTLSHITDSAMWAIAVMTMAPAVMAMGVSLFICLSKDPHVKERRTLADVEDPGAFRASDR